MLEAMNEYLPQDIAVVKVEKAEERFHARLSATAKPINTGLITMA